MCVRARAGACTCEGAGVRMGAYTCVRAFVRGCHLLNMFSRIVCTMSLLAFLGKSVTPREQPAPREELTEAVIFFRYKERVSGKAKADVHNAAQGAVSVLQRVLTNKQQNFLIASANRQRRNSVRCVPYEIGIVAKGAIGAKFVAQQPPTLNQLNHVYFLSFTKPTDLHQPAPEVPKIPAPPNAAATTPSKSQPSQPSTATPAKSQPSQSSTTTPAKSQPTPSTPSTPSKPAHLEVVNAILSVATEKTTYNDAQKIAKAIIRSHTPAVCVCMCMGAYMCMRMCMGAYMCMSVSVWVHACVHTCVHGCMCACVHGCMGA